MGGRVQIGKIRRDSIERLVTHINLAEHLRNYLELKRSGGNFVSKCPFHADASPSLYVYDDHYHCFGCNAHGNVIDYEIHRSGLPFPDAIQALAERYRFPLEFEDAGERSDASRAQQEERRRFLHYLTECAHGFARHLASAEGNEARVYLQERGISSSHIQQWGIGLAPSFNAVIALARDRGWPLAELERIGMVKKNETRGDWYDFFRSRIIIPIKDDRGNIVAFGGRIFQSFPPDRTPPKYLNSSESELFSKSKILFNYHNAVASVRQARSVVVVEGYMDCIALANAGIQNVVAVLGTALTAEHVKKLARVTDQVVLCFDSDKAGREAAKRSFEVAFPLNLVNLLHTAVPQGKDPDEFVRKEGAQAFKNLLTKADSLTKKVSEFFAEGHSTREAKVRALKSGLVPIILKNPDPAQREVALSTCAETLGLSSAQSLSAGAAITQSQPVAKESLDRGPQAELGSEEASAQLKLQIRTVGELKILLALSHAQFEDLPERLRNLLLGVNSEEPMDELICGHMLAEAFSADASAVLKDLLDAIFRWKSERPIVLGAGRTALMLPPTRGLIALSAWDVGSLTDLGLEGWLTHSQPEGLGVSLQNLSNIFSIKNQPFVRFILKDLEVSVRMGTLSGRLKDMVLQAEIAFLDEELAKELQIFKDGPASAEGMESGGLGNMESRCKKITQERNRRIKKFQVRQ